MKVFDRSNHKYINKSYADSNKLKFLYNTILGRFILWFISNRLFCKVTSLYYKSRVSKIKINEFCDKYNISIKKDYSNFNDFFTRKEDVSHVSNKNDLISPCEANLMIYYIDDNIKIKVKDNDYYIKDIILDDNISKEYMNGICLVYRLGLDNYHRYHYIDNGNILSTKYIKGKLHTVRSISKRYKVYSINSRVVNILNTENYGQVIQVEVGALLVGKIKNNNCKEFNKLDEKGYFEFGGSTIIQLFKKDSIYIDEDIIYNSKKGIEVKVYIGEKIGGKYVKKT